MAGQDGAVLEVVPLGNRIRPVTCRPSVRWVACTYSLIKPLRTVSADLPHLDVGYGRRVNVAFGAGDALGDALVRPGGVVVRLVSGQDCAQVCLANDQYAVQGLAAQGADEALACRVHPREPGLRCARSWSGGLEDRVERGGEVSTCGRVSGI